MEIDIWIRKQDDPDYWPPCASCSGDMTEDETLICTQCGDMVHDEPICTAMHEDECPKEGSNERV